MAAKLEASQNIDKNVDKLALNSAKPDFRNLATQKHQEVLGDAQKLRDMGKEAAALTAETAALRLKEHHDTSIVKIEGERDNVIKNDLPIQFPLQAIAATYAGVSEAVKGIANMKGNLLAFHATHKADFDAISNAKMKLDNIRIT